MSHMPQLETLNLCVYSADGVLRRFEVENSADQSQQPPTLLSLRSLTLRNLTMADSAVDQLLSYCPNLLELRIEYMEHLTAAVWTSLQRCRQLMSLSFDSASEVATEGAFAEAAASSLVASSSTAAFPSLVHLSLAFKERTHVDYDGFTRVISLFTASPIRSLALCLSHYVDQRLLTRQLVVLPHLIRLLVSDWDKEMRHFLVELPQPAEMTVEQLLERYTGGEMVSRAVQFQHALLLAGRAAGGEGRIDREV